MNLVQRSLRLVPFLCGVVVLSAGTALSLGADFDDDCNLGGAPPCCDVTHSLGSFRIWVLPEFQDLMEGYPGYDSTTHKLKSPTLYDPATYVGRSAPHTEGDGTDTGGATVGCAPPITVADSDMVFPPGWSRPFTPLIEGVVPDK